MKKVFAIGFYLLSLISFSQNKSYLVVSFERTFNKGPHGVESFYWIIDSDSLLTKRQLSPFYVSGFSKTNLDKCIKNEEIAIFDVYDGEQYDFSQNYLNLQKNIPKIIANKKEKVLTIKKNWSNGLNEKINIYVTPIKGNLCNCPMKNKNAEKIDYYGNVFLPIDNIEYDISYDIKKLDIYSLQKKMKLSDVSNIPWR